MRLPHLLVLSLSLSVPLQGVTQSLTLPDIGDPSRQYLSLNDEHRLGVAFMQQLRSQNILLEDVQLTEYVNSIGQRIAANAEQNGNTFTYFLITDPAINAFAGPGGFIGIYSGLLLATESEDELAGVIAHETAHVAQGHIARAFADTQHLQLPMMAALVASALLAANTKGQVGQAALATTMAAGAQHTINFTRANEQEADRVGNRLLGRAGYDPNGMANFFERLQRLEGSSRTQVPEFLLSHPLTINRIADTQDRYNGKTVRPTATNNRTYRLAKARLMVLVDADTASLTRHFEETLAKGDYADETAERYGYALALKKVGRYDEASRQIARLLKANPDRLAFRLEEAEIALATGDKTRAWRLFEAAKELYGDDYSLAMHYGRALVTQGDPRTAMSLLQPHLRRRPSDAPLYALYAQAAQRAGDGTATHATMAEYYYMNGDLKQAIEQADLGVRNPGATPYQQAQLRARLRQFKEEKEATPN